MNLSLEFLERCSAESGYQVSPLEKVVRLGEIAADIVRHPFLGEALVLKGGSALNLCYGSPSRLSVDLDYNYVAHVERERMLADRPLVEDALVDLAKRHKYQVQKSADAFAGRKIFLRYRSVVGQEERIEIDLNFLFRLPISDAQQLSIWQPGGLDQPLVWVVSLPELLAGKLLAFLDRCAARDAWDLVHLSEASVQMLQSSEFRVRFIALSVILDKPLQTYTYDRQRTFLTDRVIAEQLVPMLASGLKYRPDELAEKAWARVVPFLALQANEEKYLASIQDGNLRLDLLFPEDATEAASLARHPAIEWKIQNVKAYQSRKNQKSK